MNLTARSVVLACLVILAIGACAKSGRDFDRTNVSNIQNGVQDKAQITAWFGKPYQVTRTTNHPKGCGETWTYQSGRATHAGARASGAALVVMFDDNGKVCDHAYSEVTR